MASEGVRRALYGNFAGLPGPVTLGLTHHSLTLVVTELSLLVPT
jgi:hypothetical protein